MKKSLFGIAVVAAIVGMVVIGASLEAAGPTVTKPAKMKMSDDFSALTSPSNQAAGVAADLDYGTGFEAPAFTARDGTCLQDPCPGGPGTGTGYTGQCGFIGDGTQDVGAYPRPWAVSGSNVANIEGHIDTANPFSGAQHLRLSKDICDTTNAFSFSVDARIPASPAPVGLIAPATYSGMIAIPTSLFGANVNWQPQSGSQGFLTSRMLLFFYGYIYLLDDFGAGLTWVWPGGAMWDASGNYQPIAVHHDPCAKFMCLDGGANLGGPCPNGNVDCRNCSVSGDPCIGDFQCPPGETCDGGSCYGQSDYYYGGQLLYSGTTYAGTTSEQFLIYTDNFPGDNDVDDLEIVTGDPCPTVCGNLEIEPGEMCDGANNAACPEPGRCIAPGETGPDGEAECTCIVDGETCEEASPLANGLTTVITHGGWWTFTADVPAYAIDYCETYDYDSAFYVWTGSCNTLLFMAINDDCDVSSPYSYGYADPLAPCHPVGAPWQACTCVATNAGQQYWVQTFRLGAGDTTGIALNKRQTCDVVWEGGACCDGYGDCVDDVLEADCSDKGDIWYAQKYCPQACDTILGACCDHGPDLGGLCIDAMQADQCTGDKQEFFLDELCRDVACAEVRGSCCDHVTGICTNAVLSGDCREQNLEWTQATLCSQVSCDEVLGACLDHWNPDPLSRECLCTDQVTWGNCQGEKLEWVKGAVCATVQPTCVPNFKAIPTVSEWGLVVLTLLLLVGAKVYFSRREVANA